MPYSEHAPTAPHRIRSIAPSPRPTASEHRDGRTDPALPSVGITVYGCGPDEAVAYISTRNAGHDHIDVDHLTLYHLATGERVAMGGDHDLMDAVSHHEATGIPEAEARNRRRLRSIMESCGFSSYAAEWWHYTLLDEPHPDTYFDFPIA